MILICIFTGVGGAGGEDRTCGGVHGSLPGHRGQHCCQGGRQDQVLSSLRLFSVVDPDSLNPGQDTDQDPALQVNPAQVLIERIFFYLF